MASVSADLGQGTDAAGDRQIGRVVCVSGAQVVVVATRSPESGGAIQERDFRKGGLVKFQLPHSTAFGIVTGLSIPVPGRGGGEELQLAELELIGEVPHRENRSGRFRRGISHYPVLGDEVQSVSAHDLAAVYAPASASTVRIGRNHHDPSQPVRLATDDLLGKHLAVLGTTGCGKSSAVALLLHALLHAYPNAHMLVLDPHNEYGQAFADKAELFGPETLQLPYWLLNATEIRAVVLGGEGGAEIPEAAATILTELIPLAKRAYSDTDLRITVDTPVPYRLSDINRLLDETMGRLDQPHRLAPYRWLKSRLEVLSTDSRYAFMFGGIAVRDSMTKVLSRVLRIPVEGRPVGIFDLSAVPSEVINTVVSVLCRIIFDFALWSQGAQPVLLVCEEAHRYAPADEGLGFESTKQALARIAKEGRKYGVSLCIVSQRPSELATTILSQCSTTIAFRMTNLRDQELVRGITTDGGHGLLDLLPSLGDAEAIIVGEGVAVPLRVRFEHLPPERRPRSSTARFSSSWRAGNRDERFVAEVVERWRQQYR
jgi:hypothetical protein